MNSMMWNLIYPIHSQSFVKVRNLLMGTIKEILEAELQIQETAYNNCHIVISNRSYLLENHIYYTTLKKKLQAIQ